MEPGTKQRRGSGSQSHHRGWRIVSHHTGPSLTIPRNLRVVSGRVSSQAGCWPRFTSQFSVIPLRRSTLSPRPRLGFARSNPSKMPGIKPHPTTSTGGRQAEACVSTSSLPSTLSFHTSAHRPIGEGYRIGAIASSVCQPGSHCLLWPK